MLARSLVKGLLSLNNVRVVVVCAKPSEAHAGPDHHIAAPEVTAEQQARLLVLPVQLSDEGGWRRLDAVSAHGEFARGAATLASQIHSELHGCLHLSHIAIDWTGGAAWAALRDKYPGSAPKLVYLNFRVYSSGIANNAEPPPSWYDHKEQDALSIAQHVIALSRRDERSLQDLLFALPSEPTLDPATGVWQERALPEVSVQLPCLRGDMAALAERAVDDHAHHLSPACIAALNAAACPGRRCFVSCVNRLSAEKNSIRFAEMLETIGAEELRRRGVTPLLCGAAAEPGYANEVRRRVKAACPSAVILEHHLGPDEMAALFSHTALNVHPCAYDAYGMSVVEAAAFGAPSLVNGRDEDGEDTLGAAALLLDDGCVPVALAGGDVGVAAAAMLAALDDDKALREVARKGRERALGWGEAAAGEALYAVVRQSCA